MTPHVQSTWLGVLGALSARGGGELVLKGGTVWGGGLVGIVRYPARGNFGRLQGTLATARCCPSWPFTNAHGLHPTPPTAAILSAGLLLRDVDRLAESMQFRPRTCQLVCLPRRRSVGEGVPRMLEIAVLRPRREARRCSGRAGTSESYEQARGAAVPGLLREER